MTTRILDRDPITGIVTTFRYDHANDQFTIGEHQDCEPIIEYNKRVMIEADHSGQKKRDWIHYAKIPNVVICQWKTNYGVDFFKREDERRWMKLLNSPEYKYLKCSPLKHD